MRALLLAAGKGTRLGELSQSTPKCLQQVGDEVLLDRIVRQLRETGVTEFLVNTHHLADQVMSHIESRHDSVDFSLVHEPELLGTLGTVRANVEFFGSDPGWVLHADNFIVGSLVALREAFEARAPEVWGSMLTFEAYDPRTCGVVITDEERVVTSFYEKVPNPPSSEASAATFVFSQEVFELARALPDTAIDLSHDLIPHLVGRLTAANHGEGVIDIGTPDGLAAARALARMER